MRIVSRIVGALLISCLGAAPLGVAAEGYVCASGVRMAHNTTQAACPHCRFPGAPVQAAFERPCCTYVGSTALPPVLTTSGPSVSDAPRAAFATPGTTALAGGAMSLGAIPSFDSGGPGTPQPAVSLQRSIQLRN